MFLFLQEIKIIHVLVPGNNFVIKQTPGLLENIGMLQTSIH